MKGEPFKKILGVLKGVAPTAVAALAGPYAPLAMGVMRKVLNVEKPDDESLEAAVLAAAGDPSAVVKLKEIEAQMIAQQDNLGVRFEELANADRADARARQVALRDNTPAVLTYVLTAMFAVAVGYAMVFGLPENGGEALMLLLGQLSAGFGAGIAYHLGSSAGSKAKTDILSK